jgi:hypothetical protein
MRRMSRRAGRIGVSAFVAPIVVLGMTACAAGTSPTPTASAAASDPIPNPSPSPVSAEPTPDPNSIEARASAILDAEGSPDWPAGGFGALWLLAPDQETPSLLRVDPESLEVVATIALPESARQCQGFVVTDDAVWACTGEGAVRIDPISHQIVGSVAFPVGQFLGRLAAGAGAVWALGGEEIAPDMLVRIDPGTATASMFPLGHDGAALAFGFDAIWVTVPQEGLVLRVDPVSGQVNEHATGLRRPWVVSAGPDSLWVTLSAEGGEPVADGEPTVVRIDPTGAQAPVSIATGAAPGGEGEVWAGEDAVWVRAPDLFLVRIDPATNAVVDSITGPPEPGGVAEAFGSIWATAEHSLRVYRLEP